MRLLTRVFFIESLNWQFAGNNDSQDHLLFSIPLVELYHSHSTYTLIPRNTDF